MKKDSFMKQALLYTMSILCLTACNKKEDVVPVSNRYVVNLFEYKPAPGQFINKAPGNIESAEGILGGREGLVSLGAYGGYIVLGFDHPVVNQEGEDDFVVYGNSQAEFAEPGVIWVMQDANGNGVPDDTWYEIKGSAYNTDGYLRDYEVTYFKPESSDGDVSWRDSQGNEGAIKRNTYHNQPYYPEWLDATSYTLTGSRLPSTNIDKTVPTYVKSMPFEWGYADNTVGGDKVDIDNAIDHNGDKVELQAIDFVKIQTGIQADLGWLGELSTEISGIEDLHIP
ncbi:cell surface protein [Olivibacter sp. SDN3]|uniref:cell surface protein n=1 Tax=Olivibacter sp. SDN3 TaxID=2764720 RepID=UPI00165109E8|nr:cell surface protein [Olivibacter sp. SDN3]QNL48887.1 cell surface protein [Olivibacter sp. SDN3]